jgi:metal-responsive CopG/Arc/MetJ family transcriptional regulator
VKRISIFLSDPQVEGFKALARERDRPYSELIRDALDEYLRQRGSTTKKTERPRGSTRKRP